LAEGYLKPLYEIKQPIMTGLFAGKIDYNKLPFLLGKILQSGKMKIEEGDFRNWELITEWAKKVAEAFNIG
jgi:menaquinone-dependent protoporphyrinogen IX oxidase